MTYDHTSNLATNDFQIQITKIAEVAKDVKVTSPAKLIDSADASTRLPCTKARSTHFIAMQQVRRPPLMLPVPGCRWTIQRAKRRLPPKSTILESWISYHELYLCCVYSRILKY